MAFDIPNFADAAHPTQSAPDSVDFDALAAGYNQTGVLTGLAVSQTGGGAMSVNVAAGVAVIAWSAVAVAAVTKTIAASDSSNDRIDIVSVNGSGVVTVTTGTPASSAQLLPAIPASSVLLAAVYVTASTSAILTADIIDKRVVLADVPDKGFVAAMAVALS